MPVKDSIPDKIIIQTEDEQHGREKAPAFIPISAQYYSGTNTIEVTLKRDLGIISIQIQDLSTGAIVVNTSIVGYVGTYNIPAPITYGRYVVTFTLPSGKTYYGAFDV